MNVALVAKKGGVGKSTLSVLLHEALRQAGKKVAIRDWDSQGSSNKALRLFSGTAAKQGENYDYLIYDTPPSLAHVATAAAVQNADLVLIVTSPSPVDVWEAEEAAAFTKEKNPKAIIRLVFNKVRRGTLLTKAIEESTKEIGISKLPKVISARECYQHAMGGGWKVLDSAAREEILEWTLSVTTV